LRGGPDAWLAPLPSSANAYLPNYTASYILYQQTMTLTESVIKRTQCFCLHDIDTGSGAHPVSCTGAGNRVGGSLGLKRQRGEAYHSLPFCTEVKMADLYLHSSISLHGVVLNYLRTETTPQLQAINRTPGPESASELYRPLVDEVSTNFCR
jgi:hypothetical protein